MYTPGVPGFSLLKFNTIPLFIQKKKKKSCAWHGLVTNLINFV